MTYGKKKGILATSVAAGLLGLGMFTAVVVTPSAHAADVLMVTLGLKDNKPPAPTCQGNYVYSGKKPGCVPCPSGTKKNDTTQKCVATSPAAGGATVSVSDSGVGTFSFNMSGTIVADVHLPGENKNSPKCATGDGQNGYATVNGVWKYRFEKHVRYCPDAKSPTGYVKVGGGDTGKDCGNPFKPGHKAPGPPLKGPITELDSFNVHIPVRAVAYASVHGQCPNIDVGGSASAHGIVTAFITQSLIFRAKGKASALKVLLAEDLQAAGVAKAVANLHLKCNVPPPVTTTTFVTTTAPGTTTTAPATTTTTPKSIHITAFPSENQIPAGHDSGNLSVSYNASDSGGSLTIDAGIGSVSTCGGSPESSHTFTGLGSGNGSVCYVLYAPNDADKPASMTVTYSAALGSASDRQTQTFKITYPTRS